MKLGIVVGDGETWRFFEDIYHELKAHHQVDVFKRNNLRAPFLRERLIRVLLNRDLEKLMSSNDVVFFEWASGMLALATRLKKKCAIVTRLHRYEMFEWVHKINWGSVDKVILVSQAMRDKFIARFPDQASKTEVIPEAISVRKFQPKPTRSNDHIVNIGTLCNLIPRKGVYELVLAFYELIQKNPDYHLHIAGGPDPAYQDYFDALQSLVSTLNLGDSTTFYGEVKEAWKWYERIDVFVSNSYSEGLQVAPMEAMASGCYCLSRHWDGADELLPEEYLFYTSRELQNRIIDFSNALESERLFHQQRLRDIVCAKFDIDRTKQEIRTLIENTSKGYAH